MAAIPSRTIWRAPAMSRSGDAPHTRTRTCAPRAAASSIARSVSSIRSKRARLGRRGKHSAPADARDADAGVAHEPSSDVHSCLMELVPPYSDRRHAVSRAAVDDLSKRRALRRRLVKAQAPNIGQRRGVERLGAHAMPATAKTAFARAAASSGSSISPAESASRTTSARWMTERALSAPPSMRKCV